MQHFKTITEYCKAIGISAPKHPHFDIRRFEENMGNITSKMPPFRHEFYFIAIKTDGEGMSYSEHHKNFPKGITIFFNSPFQIISWDIVPNWSGYHLTISQDFLASSYHFDTLLEDFPFLKMDESIPFEINPDDSPIILAIYDKIKGEYESNNDDKFNLIQVYVLELLNHIKRLFYKNVDIKKVEEQIQSSDLKLLSQFENLLQKGFCPETKLGAFDNLHSPSYYANLLNIHPNHLSAVIKSITGKTALNYIHNFIVQRAKTALAQTNTSVKEIAYNLHFDSPGNFSSFFKKNIGMTPLSYRKNH
ncbi:AraC family transcriptional regulator [Marinifilum breve]|uniref:AraC family transcriptional regulator n=1 Tax=Marinifilum breve TaxID=2184082 RepID=A0A2V4A3S5_9BACT|nr:helix-turn-helix transcriptional regulator [Marinifilum breve]PXY02000.1 AraC family transcriptional regulator [Marinifilum breve]